MENLKSSPLFLTTCLTWVCYWKKTQVLVNYLTTYYNTSVCVLSLVLGNHGWICSKANLPFLSRTLIHYLFIHLLFFYSFHKHLLCYMLRICDDQTENIYWGKFLCQQKKLGHKYGYGCTTSNRWMDDWQTGANNGYVELWEIPKGSGWNKK